MFIRNRFMFSNEINFVFFLYALNADVLDTYTHSMQYNKLYEMINVPFVLITSQTIFFPFVLIFAVL